MGAICDCGKISALPIQSVYGLLLLAVLSMEPVNAAVLHDYYCTVRTELPEDVHEMFYRAMLISGVPQLKAHFMFDAVLNFGPRWDEDGNNVVTPNWDDELDLEMIGG